MVKSPTNDWTPAEHGPGLRLQHVPTSFKVVVHLPQSARVTVNIAEVFKAALLMTDAQRDEGSSDISPGDFTIVDIFLRKHVHTVPEL